MFSVFIYWSLTQTSVLILFCTIPVIEIQKQNISCEPLNAIEYTMNSSSIISKLRWSNEDDILI